MSSHKAPSAGQKVHAHPGKTAPTTQEGVGAVESGCLAAESIRSGGGFSSNPDASSDKIGSGPAENPRASKPGTSGTAGANNPDSLANQRSYAGEAPTYVEAQRIATEAHGPKPHGKDLKEGGFSGGGSITEGGRLPEPGSAQDPGRLALQGMQEGGGGGGGGPRKKKAGGDEQPFGALEGDTSA
ncbi:hypothetical protein V8F20_005738 [Naviculisporaceae sp. PSN 640]